MSHVQEILQLRINELLEDLPEQYHDTIKQWFEDNIAVETESKFVVSTDVLKKCPQWIGSYYFFADIDAELWKKLQCASDRSNWSMDEKTCLDTRETPVEAFERPYKIKQSISCLKLKPKNKPWEGY